jgi:hypothetical protein
MGHAITGVDANDDHAFASVVHHDIGNLSEHKGFINELPSYGSDAFGLTRQLERM